MQMFIPVKKKKKSVKNMNRALYLSFLHNWQFSNIGGKKKKKKVPGGN